MRVWRETVVNVRFQRQKTCVCVLQDRRRGVGNVRHRGEFKLYLRLIITNEKRVTEQSSAV